jgi:8-oxo-dGTP diphosphatase
MTTPVRILTPRLEIRTAGMEDAEVITAAKQEVWDELQKWMSWAHDGEESLESTRNYIATHTTDYKTGSLPLVGHCREAGKFALACGLTFNGDKVETGYWVAKDFLGKGYAAEACNATIRYAFDALGFKTVTINYFEGNDKSRRIIEKLGFTKTEILKKARTRCKDGTLIDVHFFEMTDPSVLPPLDVIHVVDLDHIDMTKITKQFSDCLVLTADKKILMQQRPDSVNAFGGHMEPGETPVQTVIRELEEETGAKIKAPELVSLGAVTESFTNHTQIVHTYFWHDKNNTVTGCYECEPAYYQTVADALAHPKIMAYARWMLLECQKRGLLK